MTSHGRSCIIIGANTIAAACATGAAMAHGSWAIVLAMISAGCSTLSSGIAKAPRDAKMSDAVAAEASEVKEGT